MTLWIKIVPVRYINSVEPMCLCGPERVKRHILFRQSWFFHFFCFSIEKLPVRVLEYSNT